jgi:hypothetical protein
MKASAGVPRKKDFKRGTDIDDQTYAVLKAGYAGSHASPYAICTWPAHTAVHSYETQCSLRGQCTTDTHPPVHPLVQSRPVCRAPPAPHGPASTQHSAPQGHWGLQAPTQGQSSKNSRVGHSITWQSALAHICGQSGACTCPLCSSRLSSVKGTMQWCTHLVTPGVAGPQDHPPAQSPPSRPMSRTLRWSTIASTCQPHP